MANKRPTGLYGKLPAHGDFIHRNLPSSFINTWDAWLQNYMGSAREQIGEGWLDLYLTSPIWRFVFSPGVIDHNVWAGIVMPSVDRVGRYFPFSITKPVTADSNPFELIAQSSWFEFLENAALHALDGRSVVDRLAEEINQPILTTKGLYPSANPQSGAMAAVVEIEEEAKSLSIVFPCLLDSMIRSNSPSYSVWATQGSEHVEPCFFHCPGLPRMKGIAALLDGQWQHWGWPKPHYLNSPTDEPVAPDTDKVNE